ncbi:hypothetical protein H920_14143 [Fukomys damarensis]|uniref:Uncharacterized protein n=1 Tax=Fukomys damarensis TaxID=885580 RepID=A0A091DNT2_FUKDA|nr:hypothetical protein H920_14143 [Fukomys damarensis]
MAAACWLRLRFYGRPAACWLLIGPSLSRGNAHTQATQEVQLCNLGLQGSQPAQVLVVTSSAPEVQLGEGSQRKREMLLEMLAMRRHRMKGTAVCAKALGLVRTRDTEDPKFTAASFNMPLAS